MSERAPVQRIGLAEAMRLAIRCLVAEEFGEGEEICRKILDVAPDHPDALHYAGVFAHQNGRPAEGIALIRRSLELAAEQPDWHSNLGVVLQAQGDLDGAIEAYQRAIALAPRHANAHGNLGVLRRVQGRLDEAEAAYRTAIDIEPRHADAYHNLAIVLSATNRTKEAISCYCRALTLKPEYPEARRALAMAYCALGEQEKAIQVCEEWVKDEPDSVIARHCLAACSGRDVPTRAPDEYVQKVFDSFSATFEVKLEKLHYRAPSLVADALAASGIASDRHLDVLDAGCGTGLCGPLVLPFARRLVGVDLSAGMLQHARDKGVYDELVHAELTEFLQRQQHAWDVILTADTLVYFGGLEEVAAAAFGALRPGGQFIFTVEEATGPAHVDGYAIQPNGRFVHGAEYVERVLVDAGLVPAVERGELRLELGVPVAGLIVRATKPVSPDARVESGVAAARGFGEHHA